MPRVLKAYSKRDLERIVRHSVVEREATKVALARLRTRTWLSSAAWALGGFLAGAGVTWWLR